MTIALNKKKLSFKGKTLAERLPSYQPAVYQPTAIGYEKLHPEFNSDQKGTMKPVDPLAALPEQKRSKLTHKIASAGGQKLRNDTKCHEYLAMDGLCGDLDTLNEQLHDPRSVYDNELDDRIIAQLGHKASAYSFMNIGRMPSMLVWLFMIMTGGLGALTYCFYIPLMLLLALFDGGLGEIWITIRYFFYDDLGIFFLFSMQPVYFLFWRTLYRSGLPKLLDPKLPVLAALKRDTGMVRYVHGMNDFTDIPFNEFEAKVSTVWSGSSRAMCKIYLAHKYSSACLVYGAPHKEAWYVGVLWEYMQHYMDVSRPLPDIPLLEPYRQLDPTTKAWDKKHNRPERFWRDMSQEDYEALVEASIPFARDYPYLDPSQVKAKKWKNAGDGKHWYQLG